MPNRHLQLGAMDRAVTEQPDQFCPDLLQSLPVSEPLLFQHPGYVRAEFVVGLRRLLQFQIDQLFDQFHQGFGVHKHSSVFVIGFRIAEFPKGPTARMPADLLEMTPKH